MASGGERSDSFKKFLEEVGEEQMEELIVANQMTNRKMGLDSSREKAIKEIEDRLEFETDAKSTFGHASGEDLSVFVLPSALDSAVADAI